MEKNNSHPALCSKSCSPMAASARFGLSCLALSCTVLIPLCTDLELLQLSSKSVQESDLTEKGFLTPIGFLLLAGGDLGSTVLLWGFCLGSVDWFIFFLVLWFCFWVFLICLLGLLFFFGFFVCLFPHLDLCLNYPCK